MNTLLNKLFSKALFTKMVLTLSLVLGATQAWGDELTINDENTTTSYYVPFYGYCASSQNCNGQFIIPSTSISSLNTKDITGITLYGASTTNTTWGDATFNVYVAEVAQTVFSTNAYVAWNTLTLKKSGALSYNGTTKTMSISFSTPYNYKGGNLLIGIQQTATGTSTSISWVCVSQTSNTSIRSYNNGTTSNSDKLLPKITFTYQSSTPASYLSISPNSDADLGDVWGNGSYIDYEITNNSGETVTVNAAIDDDDDSNFTVSPSSYEIASEGSHTFRVSFANYDIEDLGEKNATVTFTPGSDTSNAITKNLSANAVNEIVLSPNEDAAFGDVTADVNKVYTITNHTGSAVTITPAISGSDLFTISPSTAQEIASGSSLDFTVAFDWQADPSLIDVEKTATITLTPDNGMSAFTINASATEQAALTLDETSSSTISSYGSQTIHIKYNPQDKWNTICMPFVLRNYDGSINFMDDIFGEGWKAYQLSSCENGVLTFTKVTSTGTVGAGSPYLVYIESAPVHSNGVLITANVTYKTPGSGTTQGYAKFIGTFAPIAAPGMEGKYGITTAGKLGKGNKDAWIKGYRAYIEMSDPDPEVRPTIVFDDEEGGTTDLGFIKMVDPEAKDVYTLSGQKVEKAGKGIYIVNGRKVVIK